MWNFDSFHSRAQLQSGRELLLVIMSTKILDILENIRLRREKPPWTKKNLEHSCWSSCCIQSFKLPFSVVWGIQSSNFFPLPKMGNRIMKHLHYACTASSAHECEKCFLLFQQLLGVHVTVMFCLVYTSFYSTTRSQNMEAEKTWSNFCLSLEAAWWDHSLYWHCCIAVHQCGH